MLEIVGDQIRYNLSWLENVGAFGRDPKSSLKKLVAVSRRENPWSSEVLWGMRAPGTGFPFLIMLGTMRYLRGKDFCVVYRRRPVLLLEFEGERFGRWVIPASEANISILRDAGIELLS